MIIHLNLKGRYTMDSPGYLWSRMWKNTMENLGVAELLDDPLKDTSGIYQDII